jgi:hypothetical protein
MLNVVLLHGIRMRAASCTTLADFGSGGAFFGCGNTEMWLWYDTDAHMQPVLYDTRIVVLQCFP